MTLRKDNPVKFKKPVSTMKTVLSAIETGNTNKSEVLRATGLKEGQVRSALFNLAFIGVVKLGKDANGRTTYLAPGMVGGTGDCLKGVRSVFDCNIALPAHRIDKV